MFRSVSLLLPFALCLLVTAPVRAVEPPRIVHQGERTALFVEGKPYFIFGGQMNNSSNWPDTLPQVWKGIEALHANTLGAPVYWQQVERTPNVFDFSIVDRVIHEARQHRVHLALLWFGASKNGQMHYAPNWVKTNTAKYPRLTSSNGQRLDILDPDAPANLEADKHAYVALMHHLHEIDGDQHTVILMQVQNEAGPYYADRAHTPEGDRLFDTPVPRELLAVLHKQPGTWQQVFNLAADGTFATWSWIRYINALAEAGKAELNLPTYVNIAAVNTPTAASVAKLLDMYKAGAPGIDVVGADLYDPFPPLYEDMLHDYGRPGNGLWVAETGTDDEYAKYLFSVLGKSGIGFSPFGIDYLGGTGPGVPQGHIENYRLLTPMADELAAMCFAGKVVTAVEEPQRAEQEITIGNWQATVTFGYPQPDRQRAPGTADAHGRVLIGQLGPNEFLVTGIDARVSFHLPGRPLPQDHHLNNILEAEQGTYVEGVWKPSRIWNGDETQRGLNFQHEGAVIHVQLYSWDGI